LKVSITGKHLAVRSGMKTYVENRLEKLKRFFSAVDEAHVILKTEKYLNTAEISLNGKRLHLFAEGSSEENLYIAIDRAVERVENQIKRQVEKIKGHNHRGGQKLKGEMEGARFEKFRDQIQREPLDSKPMTIDEARMQLQIEPRNFFVFQNAQSGQINVIFKRTNGSFGLIEPQY